MFLVLALLPRTAQLGLTQCIVHKKVTFKIIYTGRTGPDRARQCRPGPGRTEPDRTGQGWAGLGRRVPDRTGLDRDWQGKVGQYRRGLGRATLGRVRRGQAGPIKVGQGRARPDRTRQGRGKSRARPDRPGQGQKWSVSAWQDWVGPDRTWHGQQNRADTGWTVFGNAGPGRGSR